MVVLTHLSSYVRYGLRDPRAAILYVARGPMELKYLFYQRLIGIDKSVAIQYESEIDADFVDYVDQKLASVGRFVGQVGLPEMLYSIARHTKPKVTIETGVGVGVSTAFLLKAMENNNCGILYSIDIPNYETVLARQGRIRNATVVLPEGTKPGLAIPDELKHRWVPLLGKSQDILPSLLQRLDSVDVFFHDGEHTYENMIFEYNLAWRHLRRDGLLLSDNATDNTAFSDFSRKVRRRTTYNYLSTLGGIRK